jgi:hypothetical protein
MNFAEMTQAALLGTERQSLSVPKGNTAVERLQKQLEITRREEALLSAAALRGVHERIGMIPSRDSGPMPEPCGPEELARMNERAGSLLLRLLGGEYAVLLPECLDLAGKSKQLALPEALPALLNIGSTKPDLREVILSVLGARGRWLAAQNPEWSWVSGAGAEDENIWRVGDSGARLLFLQRLRRVKPGRARELLAETWKEESPDERARFIAVLETGLSLEDEPFLETALDDKRKEVRRGAAALLGGVPESRLVQRMIARAKPLLKLIPGEPGKLLKLKKQKSTAIELLLPPECDKAMQRDGIEPKPPQGFGERIWWLVQILEFVPLDFWTAEWKLAPTEIVAASTGEWAKELLEGWTRAAIRQKNDQWAAILFAAVLEGKRFDKFEGLLAAMSAAQRELRLTELLAAKDIRTRELQGTLVAQCRHQWSAQFSRIVLAWLRRVTADPSLDWPLRHQLKDFAPRLAPSLLLEAAKGWPTDSQSWDFWSKSVDEFLAMTQFRADLHTTLTR